MEPEAASASLCKEKSGFEKLLLLILPVLL